jgi:hypothetical protein
MLWSASQNFGQAKERWQVLVIAEYPADGGIHAS